MAGWPSIDRADDQRLAQALHAGDASAFEALYDLYAARLYDYCHGLLRDQASAALALHDSLIMVKESAGRLTDPQAFRGRMYAITRAECLRRRTDTRIEERQRAPETAAQADEATMRMVHTAMHVLGGRQREALDLSLRHELDSEEMAEVLGVSSHDVSVLVAQARGDLDDAFAAVVIAATGREECPSVAALAGAPGRQLDFETCGKLARHIASCPTCGPRANRPAATAKLLNAMPVAALPPDLRTHVLTTALAPEMAEIRAAIAARAEQPEEPAPEPEPERTGASPKLWPVLGTVVGGIALIGALLAFTLPGSGDDGKKPSKNALPANPGGSAPAGATPSSPLPPTSATPSDTPKPTHPATRHPKTPTHASASHPGGSFTADPNPPSRSTPGTLAVSGCHMNSGDRDCRVTVTAQGGAVSWQVESTSPQLNAGGSGTLSGGASATVTVTRAGLCIGGGAGWVAFSGGGGGQAGVDWTC